MLVDYSKAQRDPDLTGYIGDLVNKEKIARGKTAARLWAMRRYLIWYAENMPNQDENNYRALDIELRRQAVEVEVYGNAVRPGLKNEPPTN